jgi:predicted RNA-binding Zn-ribbon protein involved in translation (DUF1610 family)
MKGYQSGSIMVRVVEYRTPTCLRQAADAIPEIPGMSTMFNLDLDPTERDEAEAPLLLNSQRRGEVAVLLRWFETKPDLFHNPDPTPVVGVNARTQWEVRGTPIDDFHGWPMKSMMSTAYYVRGYPFLVVNGIPLKPAPAPAWSGALETYRGLPLKPLWPEFAINTAAYAVGLGAMFASVRLAKHLWRRKHHRCTACGYDLRGQTEAGCPECGAGRAPVAREVNRAGE